MGWLVDHGVWVCWCYWCRHGTPSEHAAVVSVCATPRGEGAMEDRLVGPGAAPMWSWVDVSPPDTAETPRSAQAGMPPLPGQARLSPYCWEAGCGCFASGF